MSDTIDRDALRRKYLEERDLSLIHISDMDDRLVDTIVAWGTVDDVVARVRAHQDAGASHVCIQVLRPDREPPTREWAELAAALL